jgi:hypothetical protein
MDLAIWLRISIPIDRLLLLRSRKHYTGLTKDPGGMPSEVAGFFDERERAWKS